MLNIFIDPESFIVSYMCIDSFFDDRPFENRYENAKEDWVKSNRFIDERYIL